MNYQAPPLLTCPHCGRPVGVDTVVCGSCGAVLPIEGLLRKASASIRARARTSLFLWLLALMPLVIVPPFAALAIVLLDFSRLAPAQPTRRVALIAVALLNIGLSLAFWILAREPLLHALFSGGHWVQQHMQPGPADDTGWQNA